MKTVKMVLCNRCKETIEKRAKACPHCHVRRNDWQRNPARTFAILILIGIIGSILSVIGSSL